MKRTALIWLVLTACGGGMNAGLDGGPLVAAGGGAAGSGAAGGGAAGGTGGGGGSGTGGGSATTLALSGTLSVPPGHSVAGVSVVACITNAMGDCDATLSKERVVTGTGSTASWAVDQLDPRDYFVLAGKDVDGNGALGPGDLIGAWTGTDGAPVAVAPPRAGLALTLRELPRPSPIPAELLGSWSAPGGEVSLSIGIDANGTYTQASVYQASTCIAFRELSYAWAGTLDVQGAQLTTTPTSGLKRTTDCGGTVTTSPVTLAPSTYGWRTGVDQSGPWLGLTREGNEVLYRR